MHIGGSALTLWVLGAPAAMGAVGKILVPGWAWLFRLPCFKSKGSLQIVSYSENLINVLRGSGWLYMSHFQVRPFLTIFLLCKLEDSALEWRAPKLELSALWDKNVIQYIELKLFRPLETCSRCSCWLVPSRSCVHCVCVCVSPLVFKLKLEMLKNKFQ